MTYNRPEAAADALPFNILPAHAAATSAAGGGARRPVMMMSAEEWAPAASASTSRAYYSYNANRAPSCEPVL